MKPTCTGAVKNTINGQIIWYDDWSQFAHFENSVPLMQKVTSAIHFQPAWFSIETDQYRQSQSVALLLNLPIHYTIRTRFGGCLVHLKPLVTPRIVASFFDQLSNAKRYFKTHSILWITSPDSTKTFINNTALFDHCVVRRSVSRSQGDISWIPVRGGRSSY